MKKLVLLTLTGVVLAGCATRFEPETKYVCSVVGDAQTLNMTIVRDENNPQQVEAIAEGDTMVFSRISDADGNQYMDETGLMTLTDEIDQASFAFLGDTLIDCQSVN